MLIPERYIPVAKENLESPCGYFEERNSTLRTTCSQWLGIQFKDIPVSFIYESLLNYGYRRSGEVFYKECCKNCSQCTPIRLIPDLFRISKSQRRVWKNNQDIKIRITDKTEDFNTHEKALIYREYDFYHNHKEKMSLDEAARTLKDMHSGYDKVLDMEYYLGDRLIGNGIVDITTDEMGKNVSLSSSYFYYDISEDILKRSIGVFSVLYEIKYCVSIGIQYYYLGLYLPDCRKMNYKIKYEPYQLLEDGEWKLHGRHSEYLIAGAEIDESYDENHVQDLLEKKADNCDGKHFPYNLQKPGRFFKFPEPDNQIFQDFVTASETIPPEALISAYFQGVFPWFSEEDNQPVLWQSPDPRFVIFPEKFHVSKSIRKALKKSDYTYTCDKCFDQVMDNCEKMYRKGQNGTWIGEKMKKAYGALHRMGYAHSFEVWKNGKLAGGFYGLLMGQIFTGESMFTVEPDSSKTAFVLFAESFFAAGGRLIDCEAYTDNMARYGAVNISRKKFLEILNEASSKNLDRDLWLTFSEKTNKYKNSAGETEESLENSRKS